MLGVVVSPYHLSTRETVAMAALLIADRVVTMLPAPDPLTRQSVRAAIRRHPSYLRLLESWRWSSPLWHAGVVSASWEHQIASDDAVAAANRISRDDAWGPLRTVMTSGAMRQDEEYLERFSEDVLKGGPDPSFGLPIASGVDAFSTRHAMLAARSGPSAAAGAGGSVTQRAEALIGTTTCAVAVPVLLRAGGQAVLRARAEFEPELGALRAAIADSCGQGAKGATAVRAAGAEYARAFEACRNDFAGHDDERGERITTGYVSVTIRSLPHEASLRSAMSALRTVGGPGRMAPPTPPAGPGVTAMVVSELSFTPTG